MTQNVLTVIIPMYNMERYIDQCLSSLLCGEEAEALEVLVVNDGSTDDSPRIAHAYEARHPNVFRVIDKPNGHYGSCVNRALAEATGKYVKVLDADDYYERDNLGPFLSFLRANDLDMVFTPFTEVKEDGSLRKRLRYRFLPGHTYALSALTSRVHMCMHSVTYRTDLLRSIHYRQSEGMAYTDQEWIFLPMAAVERWQFWPHVIYHYRVGREGQSVAASSYVRSMQQENDGLLTMVRLYEERKGALSPESCRYLESRLVARAKFVYKAYLLHFYHAGLCDQLQDLRALDEQLASLSPHVHHLLDGLSFHIGPYPFRFVRHWRKSGFDPNLWGLRLKRRKKRA